MVATSPPTSGPVILASWKRDYRQSLALVVAGFVLVVAIVAFDLWANSTGNYPTSLGAGLAVNLLGTAGFFLIFFGGTVAYYHRLGLRQSRRTT
jgi:hypothetical protein